MKTAAIISPLVALLLLPLAASAHERQVFEINGTQYQFTVGSLSEPLTVDDKSGVDLRVSKLPSGEAVAGLEQTLKVELGAADKKKTLDFSAVYGTPGSYKADFYPTVATTLSYRIFGTIAGTPIDLIFTCNPAGHASAKEDTSRVEVSKGVVRTLKTGSFGCPADKADMGFPEPSADVQTLKESRSSNSVAWSATAIALAALALTLTRRRT